MSAERDQRITRVLGDEWLVPVLDDTNRDYFTRGALMVQACRDCGTAQHPPEDVCRACGSHALTPRDSAGTGRIESAAVVHHPVHPALAAQVPYVVVLVALDDAPGVRLVGNLVTDDAGTRAPIGARVRVTFEHAVDSESGTTLSIPQWRLAD
jgi:uncharacterized OB-fold protein